MNGPSPTNVENSREDRVGSNPATYPEPAVPEKFPWEGASVGKALEVVLPPVIALPEESMAMLLPVLIPSPLRSVALRIWERPLSSFITKAGQVAPTAVPGRLGIGGTGAV